MVVDTRLAGVPRYFLGQPEDADMRVPDHIVKCVVFLGLRVGFDPQYVGTAFIVTIKRNRYSVPYLVTARHVAEPLEGSDCVMRINRRNHQPLEIEMGRVPWWFHPTDDTVDVAVTPFIPGDIDVQRSLDIRPIPDYMFLDNEKLLKHNIGIGDEVFATGLFSDIQGTSINRPILRSGVVALIPNERIPFRGKLVDAYLLEGRSIGGLSGSPVFVRESMKYDMVTRDGEPESMLLPTLRFHFFGLMRGHWDVNPGDLLQLPEAEAVNMGISLVIPAHKIMEVIEQEELMEIQRRTEEERFREESGGTLDSARGESTPFTKQAFEDALTKVSRKRSEG